MARLGCKLKVGRWKRFYIIQELRSYIQRVRFNVEFFSKRRPVRRAFTCEATFLALIHRPDQTCLTPDSPLSPPFPFVPLLSCTPDRKNPSEAGPAVFEVHYGRWAGLVAAVRSRTWLGVLEEWRSFPFFPGAVQLAYVP